MWTMVLGGPVVPLERNTTASLGGPVVPLERNTTASSLGPRPANKSAGDKDHAIR